MEQKEFEAIEQYDIIDFTKDDDPAVRRAAVDKDSDNAVLVGYVHNNKGYWHPVTAQDVVSVVKRFNEPAPGDNREAVHKEIKEAMKHMENAWDLA